MTHCPSCGSSKTDSASYNSKEFSCDDCKSVFNPVMERIYVGSNYSLFCESVATLIAEKISDANLGSSIREIVNGYKNEDPKDVNMLVDRLTVIAEDLYNDYKMERRDKYDFGALIEGINRLTEFANLQAPQDDTQPGAENGDEMTSVVPDVSADPMDMISSPTDGPIEVGEHTALENLQCAIDAVQSAISSLESAESQETSAGEINGGLQIPQDDVEVSTEGLQDNTPLNSLPDPSTELLGDVPPTEVEPAGHVDPEHQATEQDAIEKLKTSLQMLKDAYATYMNSEEKLHGTDNNDSGDFTDKLNALAGLDSGVDNQTFLEKAKEMMEDAQLVNQDWMKKDLDNSIAVSTQEIGEGTLDVARADEARAGENNIPTQTFVKKPAPVVVAPVAENDPGTESGEIVDQPGEVDLNGPIHTDDVVQGFNPETFFQTEDNVLYENKQHVVVAVDGRHLTIRNPKNGHVIEVLSEDVEYANSEDIDIRNERFCESNGSLLAAWEKIEKTLTDENLNAPKRSYNLKTRNITEGF